MVNYKNFEMFFSSYVSVCENMIFNLIFLCYVVGLLLGCETSRLTSSSKAAVRSSSSYLRFFSNSMTYDDERSFYPKARFCLDSELDKKRHIISSLAFIASNPSNILAVIVVVIVVIEWNIWYENRNKKMYNFSLSATELELLGFAQLKTHLISISA